MPLSDEELRMLEQMERALAAEDPKFVSTIRGTSLQRAARRRAYVAGAALVLGMGVLLGGAASKNIWIGVVGFVVMLGSAYAGLSSWRGQHAAPAKQQQTDPGADQAFGLNLIQGGRTPKGAKTKKAPRAAGRAKPAKPQRPASDGTFMQRMEQRWRRRRETGGF